LDDSIINLSKLRLKYDSGTLVRIRGMVQDILDPEFIEANDVASIGANQKQQQSQDNSNSIMDSHQHQQHKDQDQRFIERLPIFLSPIPFSCNWFRTKWMSNNSSDRCDDDSKNKLQQPSAVKRLKLDSSFTSTDKKDNDNYHHNKSEVASRGMMHFDSTTQTDEMSLESHQDSTSNEVCNDSWWNSNTMGSDKRQIPILAKMYYDQYHSNLHGQDQQQHHLQLNHLVDCIGILEWEDLQLDENHQIQEKMMSHMADDYNSNDDGILTDNFCDQAIFIPTSIPRLHVLWFEQLSLDDVTVAKPTSSTSDGIDCQPSTAAVVSASATALAPSLLQKMIGAISHVAAKALWNTLLSMAERGTNNNGNDQLPLTPTMTPHETMLGCASMNLIASSVDDATQLQRKLCSVLSEIVPVLHVKEITNSSIKKIGTQQLPQKDNGRIVPTEWQLPKGSTIVLNVSSLDNVVSGNGGGKLSSNVLKVLQTLTYGHTIQYTFDGGVRIPFEADVRVIVISTNSTKDLLPCMLQLRCDSKNSNITCMMSDDDNNNDDEDDFEIEVDDMLPSKRREILLELRQILAMCRQTKLDGSNNNNIQLSRQLLERAQQDFVQRRRQSTQQSQEMNGINNDARTNIHLRQPGEEDFHRWLTLTRLAARGRNSDIADVCDWEMALRLDDDMQHTLAF
jgi:Mini-chromosome maintenance replisome factor